VRAEGQSAARHWPRLDQRVALPPAALQQCAVPGPSDAEAARNAVCNFALIHEPADGQRQPALAAVLAGNEVTLTKVAVGIDSLAESVQLADVPLAAGHLGAISAILRALAVRPEIRVEPADILASAGQQQRSGSG